MKKILSIVFVLSFVVLGGTNEVKAAITDAPIVSIGVGNGNIPANTSPVSGAIYSGQIQVFATVTDNDADNYHFRVIKDGGLDGYTCTASNALFASNNQGYASTTLSKDACGFVFNQSVYMSPTGFSNALIATLNVSDLIAYSGEGDYWLILGALDTAGNRTQSNYLNDNKIKITVSSNPNVSLIPSTTVTSSGSNGGGNGPIVNSYGAVSSGQGSTQNNSQNSSGGSNFGTNVASAASIASESKNKTTLGNVGTKNNQNSDSENEIISLETSNSESTTTDSDQLAQVGSSGFNFNWLWLIAIVILGGAGITYFLRRI